MADETTPKEKIEKLDIIPLTTVRIHKKVFDKIEITDADHASYDYYYSLYKAELATGNTPIVIKAARKELPTGDNDLYLRKIENPLGWTGEMVASMRAAFPQQAENIEKMYNDLRNHDNPAGEIGNWMQTNYSFYEMTTPISKEDLDTLSEEDLDWIVETHILGGYTVDDQVKDWARAGLVRFEREKKNTKLMKYRDHTLIIKNGKVGVSTIAQRTSENYDTFSEKSLEGFADAQGNIVHSNFHDNYSSANADEFLRIPDFILAKIFNFVETGMYLTAKAGKKIINEGGLRLTFTSNPKTMGRDKDGEVIGYEDMIPVFLQLVGKLTDTAGPAASRLGRIIFSNKLQTAQLEVGYSEEFLDRINAIATGILEYCTPQFTKIFWESKAWLNRPIDSYDAQIAGLVVELRIQGIVLEFWNGQRNAFRHIRGGALALACVDHLKEVLSGEYKLEDIQEAADDELYKICESNLASLREIYNAEKHFTNPEMLAIEIENIKPEYVKSILLPYARVGKELMDGVSISNLDIQRAFESIPALEREDVIGTKYAYWGNVEEKLRNPKALNKIRQSLAAFFKVELIPSGQGNFSIIVNQRRCGELLEALGTGKFGKNGKNGKSSSDNDNENKNKNLPNLPNSEISKTILENLPNLPEKNEFTKNNFGKSPSDVNLPNLPIYHSDVEGGKVETSTIQPSNNGSKKIQFISACPVFQSIDGKSYGPYEKGDMAVLPGSTADIFLKRKKAEIC